MLLSEILLFLSLLLQLGYVCYGSSLANLIDEQLYLVNANPEYFPSHKVINSCSKKCVKAMGISPCSASDGFPAEKPFRKQILELANKLIGAPHEFDGQNGDWKELFPDDASVILFFFSRAVFKKHFEDIYPKHPCFTELTSISVRRLIALIPKLDMQDYSQYIFDGISSGGNFWKSLFTVSICQDAQLKKEEEADILVDFDGFQALFMFNQLDLLEALPQVPASYYNREQWENWIESCLIGDQRVTKDSYRPTFTIFKLLMTKWKDSHYHNIDFDDVKIFVAKCCFYQRLLGILKRNLFSKEQPSKYIIKLITKMLIIIAEADFRILSAIMSENEEDRLLFFFLKAVNPRFGVLSEEEVADFKNDSPVINTQFCNVMSILDQLMASYNLISTSFFDLSLIDSDFDEEEKKRKQIVLVKLLIHLEQHAIIGEEFEKVQRNRILLYIFLRHDLFNLTSLFNQIYFSETHNFSPEDLADWLSDCLESLRQSSTFLVYPLSFAVLMRQCPLESTKMVAKYLKKSWGEFNVSNFQPLVDVITMRETYECDQDIISPSLKPKERRLAGKELIFYWDITGLSLEFPEYLYQMAQIFLYYRFGVPLSEHTFLDYNQDVEPLERTDLEGIVNFLFKGYLCRKGIISSDKRTFSTNITAPITNTDDVVIAVELQDYSIRMQNLIHAFLYNRDLFNSVEGPKQWLKGLRTFINSFHFQGFHPLHTSWIVSPSQINNAPNCGHPQI